MKIYFAGSIRGGRNDAPLYAEIIDILSGYGQVLTEHIGDQKISQMGEDGPDRFVYQRDMRWLDESDAIVAEVTTPSLGVGYEIARAESKSKKILCLYRPTPKKELSAMIAGNKKLEIVRYTSLEELKKILENFFKKF